MLKERTIIIFGGTGGIGSAVVSACFEQGANIVIVGRQLDKLARAKEKLGNSKRIITISANAENKKEVVKVFKEALEAFGCINDVFISVGNWEQNFPTDSDESLKQSRERLLPGLVSAVKNIGDEALKYFGEKGGVIFHVSSHVVHKEESELPGNHIYRELK
jgi:NAD(P)-dependent dehydrogenase (short-subunit alcohol dehydrogenase family)